MCTSTCFRVVMGWNSPPWVRDASSVFVCVCVRACVCEIERERETYLHTVVKFLAQGNNIMLLLSNEPEISSLMDQLISVQQRGHC